MHVNSERINEIIYESEVTDGTKGKSNREEFISSFRW